MYYPLIILLAGLLFIGIFFNLLEKYDSRRTPKIGDIYVKIPFKNNTVVEIYQITAIKEDIFHITEHEIIVGRISDQRIFLKTKTLKEIEKDQLIYRKPRR